jgi:hypothetical protein
MARRAEGRRRSDWFGNGDTKEDVEAIIRRHGKPVEILMESANGYMACVIYKDKVIVVGYDGKEYFLNFQFDRT